MKGNLNFARPVLLLACIGMCMRMMAQYSIQPAMIQANRFGLNDLTQTTIVNGAAPLNMCNVVIDCEEEGGEKIFTLQTTTFNLNTGSNTIPYQALVGGQALATSPKYFEFTQTGRLPAGRYTLCISLHQTGNQTLLATQCQLLNITADGQLILISPYDAQVLHTFLPNLSWMFTELQPDHRVTYTIKICELKSDQTYSDAIQFNPPIIYEENMEQLVYSYPSSAPPLNEEGRYVWQIQVSINKVPKYLSEIWMFQFKKHLPKTKPKPKKEVLVQYPYLEKSLTSSPYIFKKYISFRYKNECADTILAYTMYKAGSTKPLALANKPVKLKGGTNYFTFPVTGEMNNGKDNSGTYILEVSNSRKEKWKMKFIINNEKKKGGE